jgi:prepilin-type N-terminal cleavage/methylation domain-containing protein
MNTRGFTLVELIIVIGLITILLAVASSNFNNYTKKMSIESQTRKLYSDLMAQRTRALYEKRNRAIKMTASSYSIYSSGLTTVTPQSAVQLKNAISYTNGANIIFDTKGMLQNVSNNTITVSTENNASVDSIVVSETRISLGKQSGGTFIAK